MKYKQKDLGGMESTKLSTDSSDALLQPNSLESWKSVVATANKYLEGTIYVFSSSMYK